MAQSIKVTREELYRQVWETPMRRLAAQYGLSDSGLSKICDRLKIPVPYRGYWAKKAAGKNVVNYKLPEPDADTPREVTIHPTPEATPPPAPAPELKEKIRAETQKVASLRVPDRMGKPHPIIARWYAERDKEAEAAKREREPWRRKWMTPKPLTQTDRRSHRILDTFLKAVEAKGGKTEEGKNGELSVTLLGEEVRFTLREKLKQVRKPLDHDPTRYTRENVPSGRLIFKFERYLPGRLRTEWLETENTPLEESLPDIVATLVTAAPLLVEQTNRRIEEERQRAIKERERYEAEQRHKVQVNRYKRFLEIAGYWRDHQLAAAFLAELKKAEYDPGTMIGDMTTAEWFAWAEDIVINGNPIEQSVITIFGDISRQTAWSFRD